MDELVRNGTIMALFFAGVLLPACAKPADSTRTTSSDLDSAQAPRTAPAAPAPSPPSPPLSQEPAAPEPPALEPAAPEPPAPHPRTGTDAATPSGPHSEDAHMEQFQRMMQQNQACEKDSDCELIMPGCPFGCYAAVSATSKESVQKKLADLHKRLSPRCVYRCVGPPTVECRQRSCALRLAD